MAFIKNKKIKTTKVLKGRGGKGGGIEVQDQGWFSRIPAVMDSMGEHTQ